MYDIQLPVPMQIANLSRPDGYVPRMILEEVKTGHSFILAQPLNLPSGIIIPRYHEDRKPVMGTLARILSTHDSDALADFGKPYGKVEIPNPFLYLCFEGFRIGYCRGSSGPGVEVVVTAMCEGSRVEGDFTVYHDGEEIPKPVLCTLESDVFPYTDSARVKVWPYDNVTEIENPYVYLKPFRTSVRHDIIGIFRLDTT